MVPFLILLLPEPRLLDERRLDCVQKLIGVLSLLIQVGWERALG